MSFDEIFDLTAGVYFNFYNIMAVNIMVVVLDVGGWKYQFNVQNTRTATKV